MRNKEIQSFAATWIYLDGITLSEISQTEKDKYCMASLIYELLKRIIARLREKEREKTQVHGYGD